MLTKTKIARRILGASLIEHKVATSRDYNNYILIIINLHMINIVNNPQTFSIQNSLLQELTFIMYEDVRPRFI